MSGRRLTRVDDAVSALQQACSKFDETINSSFEGSILEEESLNTPKRIKLKETPDDVIASLKNELVKYKAKLVALETDKEMQVPLFERDNLSKQNQIRTLSQQLEKAVKDKEECQRQLKHVEFEASSGRSALQEKNEKLLKELNALKSNLNELEKQKISLSTELSDERTIENENKYNDGKKIFELERQLITARSTWNESVEQIAFFQQALEERQRENENLTSENIRLATEVNDLHTSLNEKNWASDLVERARNLEGEMKILGQWETELIQLRKENEKFRNDRSNITLMREKLMMLESVQEGANKTRQRCSELECELEVSQRLSNEWEQALVGLDVSLNSPQAVVKRIRKLQDNELCLLEEKNKLETELALLKNGQRLENEESKTIKRLERKVRLLIQERDSYKSVLDSYENDVTINPVTIQSKKATQLEATLEEYKKLTAELEANGCQRSKESKSVEIQTESSEGFSSENDPGKQGLRLIHFKLNPLDVAHNERMAQLKEVEKENGILRSKIKALEERGTIDADATLSTLVSDDPRKLKSELEAAQKRQERIMAAFKKTSKEFRQAVYCLTGYRIDMRANRCVLRHVYSEFPEDQLEFEIGENGFLHLLSNEYSLRLEELTRNYLQSLDSIPAFLSAHTLQLFNSQTMMQVEQPSMFIAD